MAGERDEHDDYCGVLLELREAAAGRGMTFREAMVGACRAWMNPPRSVGVPGPAKPEPVGAVEQRITMVVRKRPVMIGAERVRAMRAGFDPAAESLYAYCNRQARSIGCTVAAVYAAMHNRSNRDPAWKLPERGRKS